MTSAAKTADPVPFSLEPMSLQDLVVSENLLQSQFWGQFKVAFGWTPRAFRWEFRPASRIFKGCFLILERRFFGNIHMAYMPYGPALAHSLDADPSAVSNLLMFMAQALKNYLSKSCFVIRYDLTGGTRGKVGSAESRIRPQSLSLPLRPAPCRVQPPDTVMLNLELDEDALLAGMHKKTRYNIRLARKKGVIIRRHSGDEALKALGNWYELYQETSHRDGISLHSESYYRRLFETTWKSISTAAGGSTKITGSAFVDAEANSPKFSLYTAEHEGDSLAGIIIARSGKRAVYMYGASGALKREYMPNQLLQWTAIKDARNEGAREYDFFGIPPADNACHPMHGLWRFKTGFGGEILHYRGAWDYPLNPMLYGVYRWAERIRGRMTARGKKIGRESI